MAAMQENSTAIAELYRNNVQLVGSYQEIINALGEGNMGKVIERLAKDWELLSKTEQEGIISALGGRREAAALVSVFGNPDAYTRTLKAALEGADEGKTASYFAKLQDTVGLAAQRLGEQFTQLGEALFRAGVAGALKDLITIGSGVLTIVGGMTRILANFNESLGGLPGRILVLVAALRLLAATGRAVRQSSIGTSVAGIAGQAGGSVGAIGLARRNAALLALQRSPLAADGTAAISAGRLRLAGANGALRAGGGAALGLLGGPYGAALLGASVGYSIYQNKQADAKRKTDELRDEFRDHSKYNRDVLQQIVDQDAALLAEEGNENLRGKAAITAASRAARRIDGSAEQERFTGGVGGGLFGDITRKRLAGRVSGRARDYFGKKIADDEARGPGPFGVLTGLVQKELPTFDATGLSKEEIAKIKTAADQGVAEAVELRDAILGIQSATAAGRDKLKTAIASFTKKKTVRKLSEFYNEAEGPGSSEASKQLDVIKQEYEAGQTSAANYAAALRSSLTGLRDQVQASKGDARPKLLERVVEAEKLQNEFVEQQALRLLNTQLDYAEVGGTASPRNTVAALERALPQFRSPKNRQDIGKRIRDAQKQILENELAMEDDAIKRLAIARAGIPISSQSRIIELEQQLNDMSVTWGAFLIETYGSVEKGAELTRKLAEEMIRRGIKDASEAIAFIQRQRTIISPLVAAVKGDVTALAARAVGKDVSKESKDAAAAVAKAEDARLAKLIEDLKATGLGVATPPSRARATAEELKRLENEAEKASKEKLGAGLELEQARAERDPVLLARIAIREADLNARIARDAGDAAGEIRAAAQKIRAENQLQDALADVFLAQRELAQTTLEIAGDTVGAARIGSEIAAKKLKDAIDAVRAAGGDPENNAEISGLRGEMARAQANVRDTDLSKREADIDFFLQMEKITTGQAVAQLEALLQIPNITEERTRELLLKIKSLKADLGKDYQYNLGDIKLPTLYESHRLGATTAAGGSYQDNRVFRFEMVNYNAQDYAASLDAVKNAANQPPRVGTTPRLY